MTIDMAGRDWVKNTLYLTFVVVFACVMYNSLSKLLGRDTAFTQVQKTAAALQFPSVTMCPVNNADQFRARPGDKLDMKLNDLLITFHHSFEKGNRSIPLTHNSSNFGDYVHFVERRNAFGNNIVKCITYDPPGPTRPGVSPGFLARLSINITDFWMITLHDRDAYLPGLHKVFGSTYLFNIPIIGKKTKSNQQGAFTLSSIKTHYLDLGGGRGCDEIPSESMKACVAKYLENEIGCSYTWLSKNSTLASCNSPEQREFFLNISKETLEMGEQNIVKMTGCRPGCYRTQFVADALIHNVVDNPDLDPGLFQLQLYYPTNEYIERREYFLYGFPSLMADFGGYLGLLLGHSLLSLYDEWKQLTTRIMRAAKPQALSAKSNR